MAGDNAKLRVSDRARKAAIATREGASGSAYSQGPHHVDVGIDTTQVPYIRRAAGLSPRGTKTPLRNPVVMQESDRPAVVNLFAADLQARVKKAERGQL